MSTSFQTTSVNNKVSEMAENLIGSEIIKLAGEVKAKMDQGEKIYNLTIGDFNPKIFLIPNELKNEIINAYQNGETNYPPANGIQELRDAVSKFLKNRAGLDYSANQILISGGARPLIYAVYQTIIDPQDKVLFPVPSWNNNHYTHLSRGQQIFVETTPENKFMPTAAELKPYISEATLLAVCSPLNPTGTTFTSEGLREICEMVLEENKRRGASKKPLYLLYDQIYWTLTFGNTVHVDPVSLCPEMKDYTIFIDGISKSFAATGVRVGWAFGPQRIIDKMKSILSHVGAWSPKAEQVATAKYLMNESAVDTYLTAFKNEVNQRLVAFYNGLKEIKNQGFQVDVIAPEAAIYLTVSFNLIGKTTSEGKILATTADVTAYLLDEAKIAIVPFNAFGASKDSTWYRISVGTSVLSEIDALFAQLKSALIKLK
ncbi:MAG: aminotransferase class I/II-fold pyridoxal phosphate-dependent enzyme [Flavobacteriales bacterium]|nr:aminotransferase class I/II-fold pyridoxal phosphate-dependent enzyme [Flavobacteriales bacterium]